MATPKAKKPKTLPPAPAGGLGLEGIGDLSDLLGQPPVKALGAQEEKPSGKPIEILIDLIDEDPDQPRKNDNPGFSPERIAEIGASIKSRGVKSPISVRENPAVEGRFIINHGARRYRGSKWAGKSSIPAFIDNDYQDIDQVMENLERDNLTPREIADYIGRKLAEGLKKKEIAELLSRSAAYVSQHVTLLNLPDCVADAFTSGRVNDVTLINELVTAFKESPEEVEAFLIDSNQEVTRGSVKLLREFIEEKRKANNKTTRDPDTIDAFSGKTDSESDGQEEGYQEEEQGGESPKKEKKEEDPEKFKKAIVLVIHDERQARLLLNRRPSTEGFAWLKYDDDGHEFETDLGGVRLNAIIEG